MDGCILADIATFRAAAQLTAITILIGNAREPADHLLPPGDRFVFEAEKKTQLN